jgi:hypothetical protein
MIGVAGTLILLLLLITVIFLNCTVFADKVEIRITEPAAEMNPLVYWN